MNVMVTQVLLVTEYIKFPNSPNDAILIAQTVEIIWHLNISDHAHYFQLLKVGRLSVHNKTEKDRQEICRRHDILSCIEHHYVQKLSLVNSIKSYLLNESAVKNPMSLAWKLSDFPDAWRHTGQNWKLSHRQQAPKHSMYIAMVKSAKTWPHTGPHHAGLGSLSCCCRMTTFLLCLLDTCRTTGE